MKEQVLKKIQVITAKAKLEKKTDEPKIKNVHLTNSLSENIKSKEQADVFKKLLRAL